MYPLFNITHGNPNGFGAPSSDYSSSKGNGIVALSFGATLLRDAMNRPQFGAAFISMITEVDPEIWTAA